MIKRLAITGAAAFALSFAAPTINASAPAAPIRATPIPTIQAVEVTETEVPEADGSDRKQAEEPEGFDLFCEIVYAEAGNQGEHGMRLAADVIINRTRAGDFGGDTLTEVITAPNQFSSYTDGGWEKWRSSTTEECRTICREELEQVTDSTILYFTAGGYNASGTPAYRYKDHYFSTR